MLPSKVVRHKAGRFLPVILAGLILAACSGQGPQTSTVNIQGPVTASSAYYLQQAQQSSDDSKTDWQLLAIRALLKEGKYPDATQQLSQLPQQLSETQQQESLLLNAQLLIAQQKTKEAEPLLAQVKTGALSQDQLARYYSLQIASAQGRPSLSLVRSYIAQEPLLKGTDHQGNIDATWQTLTQMSPQQVSNLVINADENVLQGWLDLLAVWRANAQDAEILKSGIKDWQTRYPQNPAAKTLPTQLSQMQNYTKASTSLIALLLPLNGQAQVFANAIQKGFNDAKNGLSAPSAQPAAAAQPASTDTTASTQPAPVAGSASDPISAPQQQQPADTAAQPQSQSQSQPVAAQPASTAQIKVYDTSSQPIEQVMQQAQQDGATIVVGPLLKSNVEKVANSQTPLNVLALNEPEQIQNHPNICYFALSPEDEARDAAHHIWDQGKRQPLLLVPRSGLGDRVTNAFAQEWQSLGGTTVMQQRFGSTAELKQGINSGAGISLSGTPVNAAPAASQGVSIAGLTIPAPQQSTPDAVSTSSGGSVDAVYIVSTQDELQLIKPMIAMRTGSRSNISLFASSRSAQAGAGPDFRLEMDGLQFSDIPLLSGSNPGLMQQTAKSFNNDYSLVRLYAMGMDAWTLANNFNQMRQTPGFTLDGNTGRLSANTDCVINRKLTWNQYRRGEIAPAN
ncbi:penicillin-binding protein activator [uncultured Pantoea sp.]|uniref:penicillin-binding protein activator n=1 Tax=uncultured Pantoea sp. TaxID=218084 RepID=UPI00258A8E17|nr:penicillin-binding protein activator [uncultured Pantoea sp.]